MLKAMHKLKEAEFFLEKLEETEGKGKEFLYYLSACVTAARSISLVLQKDLRSDYGKKFDDWFDEKKKPPPTLPIPFKVINDLRNMSVKEGIIAPAILSLKDSEGNIQENAEVRVDLDTMHIVTEWVLPAGRIPRIHRREGESDDEFTDRLIETGIKSAAAIMVEELSSHNDLEILGYRISDDLPPPYLLIY